MWRKSSADSLGDLVKNLSKQLPRRLDVIDASEFMAVDQSATEGLPKRLAKEAARNDIGLQKIENRPKWACELETLCDFHIALRQVGVMQDENAGRFTVPAKVHRDRHMQLRGIEVREIVKAERGLVAVKASISSSPFRDHRAQSRASAVS